jgi:hypothetical protein
MSDRLVAEQEERKTRNREAQRNYSKRIREWVHLVTRPDNRLGNSIKKRLDENKMLHRRVSELETYISNLSNGNNRPDELLTPSMAWLQTVSSPTSDLQITCATNTMDSSVCPTSDAQQSLGLSDAYQLPCPSDRRAPMASPIDWSSMDDTHLNLDPGIVNIGDSTDVQVEEGAVSRRESAVSLAIQQNNVDLLRILIEHGADLGPIDDTQSTVLHRACHIGHLEIVCLLLQQNPVTLISKQDAQGRTALHVAVENGHNQLVKALLEHGAEVNCTYAVWL